MASHIASNLAARIPELELDARKLVFDIRNGVHGIKSAGQGDLFWQHRPLQSGEAMNSVDWRRSARSDDLYIREYERVSPQHYWIWVDLSASMSYNSDPKYITKIERAITIGLALAEIAASQGDFVGIPGIRPLIRGHNVASRLANSLKESLLSQNYDFSPNLIPAKRGSLVILSDFWQNTESLVEQFKRLSYHQTGLLVRILDKAEENFNFEKSMKFIDNESDNSLFLDNPSDFKLKFQENFATHEKRLKKISTGLGWPMIKHSTSSSALALLADIITINNQERL